MVKILKKKRVFFVIIHNNINSWNKAFSKYGMSINAYKTKVLAISTSNDVVDVRLRNKTVKQTNNFKYLGSVLYRVFEVLNRTFIRKIEVSQNK